MMNVKNVLKHVMMFLAAVLLAGFSAFIFGVIGAYLKQVWFYAATVLAAFLLSRLWQSVIESIDAKDRHVGLFGGIFSVSTIILLTAFAARAIITLPVANFSFIYLPIVFVSMLFPLILDQKTDVWTPATRYALKWLGLGILFMIILHFSQYIPLLCNSIGNC